jgi:hypothetical protein
MSEFPIRFLPALKNIGLLPTACAEGRGGNRLKILGGDCALHSATIGFRFRYTPDGGPMHERTKL